MLNFIQIKLLTLLFFIYFSFKCIHASHFICIESIY